MDFQNTSRGFAHSEFKDSYGQTCKLNASSRAGEPCIWFGVAEHPMHLTQSQVTELLPALIAFRDTGDLTAVAEGAEEAAHRQVVANLVLSGLESVLANLPEGEYGHASERAYQDAEAVVNNLFSALAYVNPGGRGEDEEDNEE